MQRRLSDELPKKNKDPDQTGKYPGKFTIHFLFLHRRSPVGPHGTAETEGLGPAAEADDEHVLPLGGIVGHGIHAAEEDLVELVEPVDVAGVEAEKDVRTITVRVHDLVPVISLDAKGGQFLPNGRKYRLAGSLVVV
jgi:hypothetical protein